MSACPIVECVENVATEKTAGSCEALRLNKLCYWPQPQPAVAIPGMNYPQVAASPVFISEADMSAMRAAVSALDQVMSSPAWAREVLGTAARTAQHDPGNAGVLYGFDFHLTANGPKLIEINTNAGGALVSAKLLGAQPQCCTLARHSAPLRSGKEAEESILKSFLHEWRMVRQSERPGCIAIVDERPDEQYLAAEFRLFAELFASVGIDAVICDPRELTGGAEGLSVGGRRIDLVYNRLTDFYLEARELEALRSAYLADKVVLTPHPRAHALYADKKHLIALADPATLSRLGVDTDMAAKILAVMVPTRRVRTEDAETLWRERRSLFFKPMGAFGGRGVYEGAKLTRSAFERLLTQDYVAQAMIPPPMRQVWAGGEPAELKYDVRCYAYRGNVQLVAARLFRGQATNFRTPGGGFASVHVVPA